MIQKKFYGFFPQEISITDIWKEENETSRDNTLTEKKHNQRKERNENKKKTCRYQGLIFILGLKVFGMILIIPILQTKPSICTTENSCTDLSAIQIPRYKITK